MLAVSHPRTSDKKLDSSVEKSAGSVAACTAAAGAEGGFGHGTATTCWPSGSFGGSKLLAHAGSISGIAIARSLEASDGFLIGGIGVLPCDLICQAFGLQVSGRFFGDCALGEQIRGPVGLKLGNCGLVGQLFGPNRASVVP